MIEKIDKYIHELNDLTLLTEEDKIHFHQTYLGKSGLVTQLFIEFKTLPNNKKKDTGKRLNVLKQLILTKQNATNEMKVVSDKNTNIDFTLPSNFESLGSEHPLSKVQNKIVNIFERVGFVTSEGPEIEDDWHNFSALNMLKDHPARDMQDTFFITSDLDTLLRTHTSSVQTRYMEENTPPCFMNA